MLKNGHTYFKNPAVRETKDFKVCITCMERLTFTYQ